MSLVAMSLIQSVVTADSPDSDLADFRLDQMEGGLEKMPHGAERDCLAGSSQIDVDRLASRLNSSIALYRPCVKLGMLTRQWP
jgi:hypothetical protein